MKLQDVNMQLKISIGIKVVSIILAVIYILINFIHNNYKTINTYATIVIFITAIIYIVSSIIEYGLEHKNK